MYDGPYNNKTFPFVWRIVALCLIIVSGCIGDNIFLAFLIKLAKNVATPLWASVRMRLTLPKVGTWSPLGLPQLQSSTTEGKTPCLEVFFIPLERSWSLDVENGLAWAIWTSETQVIGKRRAGSQTASLTPDH